MIKILSLTIVGVMCVTALSFLIFIIRYYRGDFSDKKSS